MRSAFEHCEPFLAQETFQDQYTDAKIDDRVVKVCPVFFSTIGFKAHFEQFIGASQVIYVFEYLL